MPRSSIPILLAAMRELAAEIICGDGVANAALFEAATRFELVYDTAMAALAWYDRDGSVGGCSTVMEDLRDAIEGKTQ